MEKVESMRAKPVFSNRIQSLKPSALVLPDLPKVPVETTIPLTNTPVANVAVGNAGQTGMGSGSGSGSGFFGGAGLVGSGLLEGYLYDLKQTKDGQPTEMTPDKYNSELRRFIAEGWKDSSLAGFFRGPDPLFTRQLYIPKITADSAPKAFKVADKVQPRMWAVLYRGTISPTVSGRFRFVGYGDDILVVRFNKKVVLDGSIFPPSGWQPREKARPTNYDLVLGDWLTVGKGEKDKIEILIGEQPGGLYSGTLMVEYRNAKYQNDKYGNPILAVFRLAGGQLPPVSKLGSTPPFDPTGPVWNVVTKETMPALPGLPGVP